MKKAKFGTIVLVINVLATMVLIATAIQGSHMVLFGLDPTRSHVLLALTATLGIFFSHTWVTIYLVSLGREVRNHVRESGGTPREQANSTLEQAPKFLGWLALAVLLILIAFFLGPAVLLGKLPPWTHVASFFVALAVHIWALVVEKRALHAGEQQLLRLHQS